MPESDPEFNVHFVMGSGTWQNWIPPFLSDDRIRADWIVQEGPVPGILPWTPKECPIVFLSHHSTIERDAAWKTSLISRNTGSVVAQSLSVARLAMDKRLMADAAQMVPGLLIIPELQWEEMLDQLNGSDQWKFVIKPRRGTEGQGIVFVTTGADLATLPKNDTSIRDSSIVQPLCLGEEVSVNLACYGGRSVVFPPVWKGESGDRTHPSRRLRFCPLPPHLAHLSEELIRVSTDLCQAIGCEGLVEIEFIARPNGQLFLLEVNPRLSATMRLASAVARRSIFTELAGLAIGNLDGPKVASASCVGAEFFDPRGRSAEYLRQLANHPEIWCSSRVTFTADCTEELALLLERLRA